MEGSALHSQMQHAHLPTCIGHASALYLSCIAVLTHPLCRARSWTARCWALLAAPTTLCWSSPSEEAAQDGSTAAPVRGRTLWRLLCSSTAGA